MCIPGANGGHKVMWDSPVYVMNIVSVSLFRSAWLGKEQAVSAYNKRALDCVELEFWLLSHHVSARNRTRSFDRAARVLT